MLKVSEKKILWQGIQSKTECNTEGLITKNEILALAILAILYMLGSGITPQELFIFVVTVRRIRVHYLRGLTSQMLRDSQMPYRNLIMNT